VRYMIGSISTTALGAIQAEIPDVCMMLSPAGWRAPRCSYACDNGVYGAWTRGKVWDQEMHCAYLDMLSKVPPDNLPIFVLLPDAVADWDRTVELAGIYLPMIRQKGFRVAIALQDGCSFEQVMDYDPDWVFVAGSTEWKEDNIGPACEFFHARGIKVHVGRVNTRRRLRICQAAGVDSCDGTCLNKYMDANLSLIAETLKQPCLQI
jgi:hypothetical protein